MTTPPSMLGSFLTFRSRWSRYSCAKHGAVCGVWMPPSKRLSGCGIEWKSILFPFPSDQTAAIIEEVAEQYSPGAVHSDDTQQLSRLCSAHFTPDAFEEDLYARYVGRSPGKATRRRLKGDAFPTEFAFTATVDGSATEQRQVRERRRAQASIDVYRQTTKARP